MGCGLESHLRRNGLRLSADSLGMDSLGMGSLSISLSLITIKQLLLLLLLMMNIITMSMSVSGVSTTIIVISISITVTIGGSSCHGFRHFVAHIDISVNGAQARNEGQQGAKLRLQLFHIWCIGQFHAMQNALLSDQILRCNFAGVELADGIADAEDIRAHVAGAEVLGQYAAEHQSLPLLVLPRILRCVLFLRGNSMDLRVLIHKQVVHLLRCALHTRILQGVQNPSGTAVGDDVHILCTIAVH